jgi:hypothetical protein
LRPVKLTAGRDISGRRCRQPKRAPAPAAALRLTENGSRQPAIFGEMFKQLDAVTQARRIRLHLAAGVVPGSYGWSCCAAQLLTVGFTFFFGTENLRAQVMMTGVQVRRGAAHDVAQSLQVAPEPRRPFPERRNRPGRHVNAILHGRRCPLWRQAVGVGECGPIRLETFLYCNAPGVSCRKSNPSTGASLFRDKCVRAPLH